MDVISIMQKKRQDVTDFEVRVHTERAETHPKVFTHGTIKYIFVGHGLTEKAVQRSIELSAVRYCPAQGMLAKVMDLDLEYEIYEERDNGMRELISRGTFVLPEA